MIQSLGSHPPHYHDSPDDLSYDNIQQTLNPSSVDSFSDYIHQTTKIKEFKWFIPLILDYVHLSSDAANTYIHSKWFDYKDPNPPL